MSGTQRMHKIWSVVVCEKLKMGLDIVVTTAV